MEILTDIKLSLIENIRARLPAINLFPDPPQGEYDRPVFHLAFLNRKRSKDTTFGMIVYDYAFEVAIEVLEDTPDDVAEKTELMEEVFVEGETFPFYHFVDTTKYLREGQMKVSKFIIQEGKKDRERNSIKADLIITF